MGSLIIFEGGRRDGGYGCFVGAAAGFFKSRKVYNGVEHRVNIP